MYLRRRWSPAAAVATAIVLSACGATAATSSKPSNRTTARRQRHAAILGVRQLLGGDAVRSRSRDLRAPRHRSRGAAGLSDGARRPVSLLRSNWVDWKPRHKPPYTVGIAWVGPVNDFQRLSLQAVQATLKASPEIKNVITEVTSSVNVPEQLQQYNQLVADSPDIILLDPILVGADKSSIDGPPGGGSRRSRCSAARPIPTSSRSTATRTSTRPTRRPTSPARWAAREPCCTCTVSRDPVRTSPGRPRSRPCCPIARG